jgi:hypothetical protein
LKHLAYIEHTLQRLASPKRSHTFWGLVLVLLAAYAVLWPRHAAWLSEPDRYYLSGHPAQQAAYFNTAWHVARDSVQVHFGGMNYPYGEHVLFTDGQPLVMEAMQWWSRHVSDLRGRTTGLLNLWQFVSLLLSVGVLYLLFRKLHFPVWYAGAAALGILLLSPQNACFASDFGLSHSWVFPLLLLLLCRYEERHSRRYQSLQMGVLAWLAAQIHLFYFALSAIFLLWYTAYQLLRDFSARNLRVRLSHLVVTLLLPSVMLNIWLHWAHYTPERAYDMEQPGSAAPSWSALLPWGAAEALPVQVGTVATAFVLGLLCLNLAYRPLRRALSGWRLLPDLPAFMPASWMETAYHRVHKRYLEGIFAASAMMLLFACGFPQPLKNALGLAEPLGHFCASGRFAWAFYHVANVLAFYLFWNWSVRFKGFGTTGRGWQLRWAIALLPLGILYFEGLLFQQKQALQLCPNPVHAAQQAPQSDPWLQKVPFQAYQALLPLPYYHLGSALPLGTPDSALLCDAQCAGLLHGIPNMAAQLHCSAREQTVRLAQLALPLAEMPGIADELPDGRPLLLLVEQHQWDSVRLRYPQLLQKAIPVYNGPRVRLLALAPDSLRAAARAALQLVETERGGRVLLPTKGWESSVQDPWFYAQNFDSLTAQSLVFQGNGAYAAPLRDTLWLWDAPLPSGRYTLSFWVQLRSGAGLSATLWQGDAATRPQDLAKGLRSIVGDWGLVAFDFEVPTAGQQRIFLHDPGKRTVLHLDELLLKQSGFDLYKTRPGWVVRNNYWYKTSTQ